MQASALFRYLSALTVAITCGHLLFGNIVSGTESGMGCGPHWPLCQGQLIPPLNDPALVIEWTHRLFALLVGVSILALALGAWRRERDKPTFVWLTTASLALVVVVAIFGGITVLLDLPKAVSTAHFGLGTLLFALLVVLAAKAHALAPTNAGGSTHRWALFSVILVYLQAVLGAYVRHSQAGMALPLWPFLTFFPNLAISPIAHQWSHRLFAVIVLGVVALTATRAIKSGYTALGVSSVALVLVQIALGVLTVWSLLNPIVAMLHLAGALALLGIQIVLTVWTWPVRAYAPVPAQKGEAQAS
ncbi:MAG: COX15/CtaA family protein [Candidatus Bipolaricaulota bacterium]|nr:COX15/CtaA family protein [Candidatus Bipolaricaulota bacterium]